MSMNIVATKIKLHAEGVRVEKCHLDELLSKYHWDHPCFFLEDVAVTLYYGKWAESSPFEILPNNGGYALFRNGEFFTDVSIPPKPNFLERTTSDGTPMYKIGELIFPGTFMTYANQNCIWWKSGKQCHFCSAENQVFLKDKTPQQIAETVETALAEGAIKTHVSVTTGWQSGPDVGIAGVAEVVKAVKESCDIPVCANVGPPAEEEYLELLSEAGADSIEIDIECFDPEVRPKVLPGKGRVAIERYDRAWKKIVELVGENQAVSIMLAGLGESDSSILEGAEHIANLGVIPFLAPCHPTRGSLLDGKRPPSAERMTKLYLGVADIIKEHGLDPFKTQGGIARVGGMSALREVLRFGI